MQREFVDKEALVLLSGGQDSATCLAWAENEFKTIHTVSFDYGQRHRIELGCAAKLSDMAKAKSHREIVIDFSQLAGSALVGGKDIIETELPAVFVPGRNFIFLGMAAAVAWQLQITHLVTGVCQTDYTGFPDCRDNSIKAVQVALSNCLEQDVIIHTPLMWKTKAETITMMVEFRRFDWYGSTHTCYEGKQPPCGECLACRNRAAGFAESGERDPLLNTF